jgi:uncharacterized peroxidase-related enzyme
MPLSDYQQTASQDAAPSMHANNLSLVSEADASAEVRELYGRFREEFSSPRVPGILQCFATHPPLLEHMMGLAKSMLFSEGALGRRTKEMIATFVSSKNNCGYCADSHGYFLRMHGGSVDLLTAAMACDLHTGAMEAADTDLLSFVAKVTDAAESVTPDDIALLRSSGWTDLQIAETIHLTALFACFNRVVSAFGLESQGLLTMYAADREKLGEAL